MTITAKVIADSISEDGIRLTTVEARYNRFFHAEVMTHRMFCLGGDSRLDFELPTGGKNGCRRVHSMLIKDFVEKWENGAAEHKSSRHNGVKLSLPNRGSYTAKEVSQALGFTTVSNVNAACRHGLVEGAEKLSGQWIASAESWEQWRNATGTRRFSVQNRLSEMYIRQIDEKTGNISLASVVSVQRSGVKDVYTLRTRNYSVSGSADHLIFTERGWVRIGDLVIGTDRVATYAYGTGTREDPFKKIDGKWVSKWNLSVRDEVAERQNQKCAQTGDPLKSDFHIHHVQPRHERPDLAFDIDNVVAVNSKAHHDLHGIQGWQKGVPLQAGFETVETIQLRGREETFDLEISGEFPNFFANGIVVHNSRNASSSRAIPVRRAISMIRQDPAMPVHWGANQKGMQAENELSPIRAAVMRFLWLAGMWIMTTIALLADRLGAHKQIVNRLCEPWAHITVVISATEWANFFELRRHPDAQPEIQVLANAIFDAFQKSTPKVLKVGEWHLPYIELYRDLPAALTYATANGLRDSDVLKAMSAARCARVSYLTHDGTTPTVEADLALYKRLAGSAPIHASPLEHQATPTGDAAFVGNLRGWRQFRKEHGNENHPGFGVAA